MCSARALCLFCGFAVRTSFWMVSFTLMRFECGSVQTKPASMRRTLVRPLSFLRHSESSWLDSSWHTSHWFGGCRYRSQNLHQCSVACFGMPSVMSTSVRMQSTHMLDGFGAIGTPHWQQRLAARNPPHDPPIPVSAPKSTTVSNDGNGLGTAN